MFFVGVDVGGTNLKIGLIENNRIIDKDSIPTNSFDIVKQIMNSIRDICSKNNIELSALTGVGIGFPGIIINGKVVESSNIGLTDCQLNEIVADELGVPCVVRNDGEMAVLAEHRLGSGKGTNNMLLLTIGTGIGGGIIINNQLYVGNGGAGELGHITLVKDGLPCGCGRSGCAEKYLSAISLQNNAKEYFREYPNSTLWNKNDGILLSDLISASEGGDECAQVILREYVEHFADYLLGFCNIFRPEKILLGGGISHAPKIVEMIAKKCRERNFGFKGSPEVDIELASLGNDAGVLGTCVCFADAMGFDLDSVVSESKTEPLVEEESETTIEENSAPVENVKPLAEGNVFELFANEQPVSNNDDVSNTISSDYGVEEDMDEDLPESEGDSLLASLYKSYEKEEGGETEKSIALDQFEKQVNETYRAFENPFNFSNNVASENPMSENVVEDVSNIGVDVASAGYSAPFEMPTEMPIVNNGQEEIDPYDDDAEGMGNSVNTTFASGMSNTLSQEEMMARMFGTENNEE